MEGSRLAKILLAFAISLGPFSGCLVTKKPVDDRPHHGTSPESFLVCAAHFALGIHKD